MGCRSSKERFNKEGEKQKMCKIGLSLGRNDLKVEGNFQIGYHSKTDKKYTAVDGITKSLPNLPTIREEAVDGITTSLPILPTIREEAEE